MRRKWILILTLSACALLVWRLFYSPESQINRIGFEMLQIGMTQAEVEQILGGPARDECGQTLDVWVPRGDTLNSMRLDPGRATNGVLFREDRPLAATANSIFVAADFPEGTRELVWLSDSVLIAVMFDQDGRLLEKHVSDVMVRERPTVLDWLRTRL